jgi:hypothetical protein
MVQVPSVHGDWAYFFSQTVAAEPLSTEIFRVSLPDGPVSQVTVNDSGDGFQKGGDAFVVYVSTVGGPDGGYTNEYRYYQLADASEHAIAPRPAASEDAFDGYRWFAFTGADGVNVYRFDLLDPGTGPNQVGPDGIRTEGLAFDRDTGVLIVATYRAPRSDDWGLETWDIATGETTDLLDDPWSQVIPDVDGHVVAYQDSQAAGESYWDHQRSELRIVDRDTGAKRVVMPLDTYYGVGIWERWIAFNNYGMYGDSLIICDLVAAGYMDEDLHVIPE